MEGLGLAFGLGSLVACSTLRGSVAPTFFGIVGMSSSEILTSDWVETIEGRSWPGLVSAGNVLDATPDYIMQAIPVTGGYVYTRQSFDGTTVDLIGPSGTIYTWVSSETSTYALAVDASGDYWLVVAEDDGAASADNSLWRVTPAGVATKEVASTSASDGVSQSQITTTPDGAVWFAKFGAGSGLYRWASGAATAVTGVAGETTVPRPDSSVWFNNGTEWRSITAGLVVSSTSPCSEFDAVYPRSVAWTADWSIIAVQSTTGAVYEMSGQPVGLYTVGRIRFPR